MADRIRLLPEVVANQIAAGEVVNHPASVVKEMMENAIDAGARNVKVNFRDGGKELIQIVDDGCGMSPIDARMAFDRHATSKIGSVDDIYALHTFGFRGEALASIAAVAQVELRTRQPEDEMGTVTEINGGQFVSQNPQMCPVGSQFFVRNLFYNVPARRHFLEKSTTSAARIKTEFQRVALCYPQVGFELYANDALVYSLGPSSLAGRIVDVVGRHIKQNLLEVKADTSIASIEGYIGRPAGAKRRNSAQYLFVNGRYFKSSYLSGAVMKAYEKLIPESVQPSFFLYLTIDPSRIDVNVHPQKTEVKFADEEAVWQIVNAALRETLAKTGAVPMMDFDSAGAVEIPVLQRGTLYREPRAVSNSNYNPFLNEYADPAAPDPNVEFAGFDIPYGENRHSPDTGFAGGMSDVEFVSGADYPQGGVGSSSVVRGRDALSGAAPDDEFEEFASGAGLDDAAGGSRGGVRSAASGGAVRGFAAAGADEAFTEVASAAESGLAGAVGGLEGGFSDLASAANDDFTDVASAAVGGFTAGAGETGDAFAGMESSLDFIPSTAEAEQQRLDTGTTDLFTDAMPVGNGYLAAVLAGRFVVVDVRRARERILYEEYLGMLGHGSAASQQLLFPERLTLSEDEYSLLESNAVEFAALGFDIEFCGEGSVEVKGTPADLPADSVDQSLFDLLQAFDTPVALSDIRREKIAAVMARSAVRGVQRLLTREEAAVLLERLAATGNVSFSPSGKAILAEIPVEDIRARLG